MFGVTRHLANAMIFGHLLPPAEQLDKIAEVLEVCPKWLSGVTDRKKLILGAKQKQVGAKQKACSLIALQL
ncbi:hypothetical protein [Legionella tunisiensis]|uniref:hypothetical protein n=1 Tax=Legionella tunisiensis TaxID=1034944 RepID=UPI001E55AC65|nr:hypothetical protein [Legionella tunisiensis]